MRRPRSSVALKRVSSERSVSSISAWARASSGKAGAHLADQRGDQPPHHRVLGAEQVGVAHGAAHDPAQHVAAALVRGQHAVGDQERGRAQVVGDHPVVDAAGAVGVGRRWRWPRPRSGRASGRCRSCRACPAAPRRRARAPCRCRSTGAGSGVAGAVLELLELHEDEVPDLDEAVAVLVGAARRAAGDRRRRGRRRSPSRGRRGRSGPSSRNCPMVAMRMMRSSGRPATFFQSSAAASSSW